MFSYMMLHRAKGFIRRCYLGCIMQVDTHSFDRMTVRLTDEEKEKVLGAIETKWNRLENNTNRDFAIIALSLDSLRMTDNSGMDSNGEAVVGVVRHGTLKTVMLRRFNQPMTKEAIRVDAVKWAIPIPKSAREMMRRAKKWTTLHLLRCPC